MIILIVDDDIRVGEALAGLLSRQGHQVKVVHSGEEALPLCRTTFFDVAFLDVMLPGMDGLQTLPHLLSALPRLKVYMISGHGDVSLAVRATKSGAYDFLEKPLNPDRVLLEMNKAAEQQRISLEVDRLKVLVDRESQMLGESPAMADLREQIQRVAPSEGRILIYGENGSGKELVARQIHNASRRALKPFIQLNCAALPRDLIESELFGYEKGAFTGAQRRKLGLMELADQGTLLLDEVADMALETQAKLLRVLQENEFYRLGGSEPQHMDVRIIAATNKDLLREIERGTFRQDLYYRLNVVPITVPSLHQRVEDIPLLAEHFMQLFCQKNGKRCKEIQTEAMQRLKTYRWPGNVRELKNIIERLAIMTDSVAVHRQHVEAVLQPDTLRREPEEPALSSGSLREQMADYERQLLQAAFQRTAGNVSEMARNLQTDRPNLHKKLIRYGIKE